MINQVEFEGIAPTLGKLGAALQALGQPPPERRRKRIGINLILWEASFRKGVKSNLKGLNFV